MPYCWGKPPNGSTRFHIFRKGHTISLCRKWMYGGADQELTETGVLTAQSGDCKACVKELNAIKAGAKS